MTLSRGNQEHSDVSTLFDRYVMIDWSSTNGFSPKKPCKDAVWMGVAGRSGSITTTYFRSRASCVAAVLAALNAHRQNERILVGFDFPYGYPKGLAAALALKGPPWRSVWDELARCISDSDKNKNERFRDAAKLNERLMPKGSASGPFWGRPSKVKLATLSEGRPYEGAFLTRAGLRLQSHRQTEQRLPGAQSAWKLYTAGSVGGQALLGIPRVRALRDAVPESCVWPFETGFSPTPTQAGRGTVLAEIWPGVIDDLFPRLQLCRERDRTRKRLKKVRRGRTKGAERLLVARLAELDAELGDAITDQLQVEYMCEWARNEDDQGTFGRRFAAPPDLSADELATCAAEEGWILGAH